MGRKVILALLGTQLVFHFVAFYPESAQANGGVSLFFSPSHGTNLVGSTFDVSALINTEGESINTVQLEISFPADKVRLISPSSGTSILGVWLEPPVYSNVNGTVHLVGIVPGGIKTDGGFITTMTFEALKSGSAVLSIRASSKVLANDGLGTSVLTGYGQATFTLTPKPPEGVAISSDTHPFADHWYNNNSPVLTFEKAEGVSDFSYELDDRPFTIPDNEPETTEAQAAFESLKDGLWYFHVKARSSGAWGTTTHYPIRIDTTPPAVFMPFAEKFFSGKSGKVLVSFFTTDNQSGIDHYDIGVLEASAEPGEAPAFVRTESPFQLSTLTGKKFRVVVRVFDQAGNVRDENVDIDLTLSVSGIVKKYLPTALFILSALVFLYSLFHLSYLIRLTRSLEKEGLLLLGVEKKVRERSNRPKYNRYKERRQKTVDFYPLHERAHEPDKKRIDHKSE
jgi:hypothetical protein